MQRRQATATAFQLGKVRYFPSTGQLRDRNGAEIYLRAQSAKVLHGLVERLGSLYLRDELIQFVWPDLAVTDDSLTQCIADIRRAIGDINRMILKTVPKRGFVLYGTTVEVWAEPSVHATSPVVTQVTSQPMNISNVVVTLKSNHTGLIEAIDPLLKNGSAKLLGETQNSDLQLGFADLELALSESLSLAHQHSASVTIEEYRATVESIADFSELAKSGEVLTSVEIRDASLSAPKFEFKDLGIFSSLSGNSHRVFRLTPKTKITPILSPASKQPMLPTVAVLPLMALSENEPPNILGTIFADTITTALASSEEINVTSRLSTGSLGHGVTALSDLGRLLNAEFILSGSYVQNNETLILNLEFSKVTSQRMLWSQRLETSINELLNDFDAVHEIVTKIRRAIAINEIRQIRSRPLETVPNYSLLYAAVGLMHRLSPLDFNQSKELLNTLIARAPNHPIPLAWKARWHVLRVIQGWSEDIQQEATLALDCTKRALDIDPENIPALVSEGSVRTNLLRQLGEAEGVYDVALSLNPNESYGLVMRGILKAFQDRGQEGQNDTDLAIHLTPLDPHRFFYFALGSGASLAAGNLERAVQLGQASLRLNRTHASTLRTLAVAYFRSGMNDEAHEMVKEVMRQQPKFTVGGWLAAAPSADFAIGREFAKDLRHLGVPE